MDNEVSKHSQDGSDDSTYSLLDIGARLASREVRARAGGERRCNGDHLRAINELTLVNTEQRKSAHDIRERLGKLLLVVRERLPLARRARVTRKQMVRLQTHLAAQRGRHLALDSRLAWEGLAPKLSLEEELGVEELRGRVEGRARDRVVDTVGGGDGVGGENPDDFEVLEADVEEAVQNLVDSV